MTVHPSCEDAAVDLYWLPLGAGGHSVRFNGRVFEAVAARVHHRSPRDLYHSALEVRLGPSRYTVEMAPAWNERAEQRGVVKEGAVGDRRLGRWRAFSYEVRCWRGGRIPDVAEAVDSPQRLSDDAEIARRVLALVAEVPAAVWGRDELRAGEMWNSNSVISWLITSAGLDPARAVLPAGGRAPGWDAGITVARRRPASPLPALVETAFS